MTVKQRIEKRAVQNVYWMCPLLENQADANF
jgi:hypothetical protein